MISLAAQADETITVADDGTYDLPDVMIDSGERVVWEFPDTRRSVVHLAGDAATRPSCSDFAAYEAGAVNEFTGPMPEAASGIFALGPKEESLRVVPRQVAPPGTALEKCLMNPDTISDGTDALCRDLDTNRTPAHRVLDEVLHNSAVSGVFLRYDWSEIEPVPGIYDFTSLDAEIDRIVAAGKVYSLAIKAGVEGTPSWLGDDLNLPLLQLQDIGGDRDRPGCGTVMFLGNPTDTAYAQRYFQMLRGVADHLKANAARYRALAYIKASGANLHSHENRLPERCEPQCPICNPAVWAANGYTPERLYEFYEDQFSELEARFPLKTMSYQLIQAGFPKVVDADHYEGCVTPDCEKPVLRLGGTEQTEEVLKRGRDGFAETLAVQHNGLGPIPEPLFLRPTFGDPLCSLLGGLGGPSPWPLDPGSGPDLPIIDLRNCFKLVTCPNEGIHPADPRPADGVFPPGLREFARAGTGCPNKWVLHEGAQGQVTGFQTNNTSKINTLTHVDQTLLNGLLNSDAVFIELYEHMIWLAGRNPGPLDPSAADPRDLDQWAAEFVARRLGSAVPPLPDPYPQIHSHTFENTEATDLTYWYTDPAHCDASLPDTIGKIVVTPP